MVQDIKNVAVYLRKSRGESIKDLQKHRVALMDLCTKNNFTYVVYSEFGTSESIDMRPEFSKLLKDVEQGMYDAVCVIDFDRLGRGDSGEQDRINKVFKNSETLIVTPDKVYDLNNDTHETFADFKGFLARQEYKMITKRLKQGKKIGSRLGNWTNGNPPYPYEYQRYKEKYKSKGLVVNDEKLAIYRKIIDMALEGLSTMQIAIQLNKEGIKSPNGKAWSNVTINRMLIDETHLGKIISNKTQGDGHKKKKPNAKPNVRLPKSEWLVVENCHEAVKTPQEHERILAFLSERRLIPVHARKGAYSLSGLLFCKVCGHGLTFLTNERGKFLKPCWYKDHLGNKCKNGGIKYELLEKLIIDDVVEKYESQEIPKYDEDTFFLNNLKKLKSEKEELIKKLEYVISRINDAYEVGDYTREEWLKRKEVRNSDLNVARNDLFEIENRIKNFSSVSEEERRINIKYFLDNIDKHSTPEEMNSLFSTIISKVIWYRKDGNIELEIQYK